jgi:enoyl-CoA hydratase/carnithine racemase
VLTPAELAAGVPPPQAGADGVVTDVAHVVDLDAGLVPERLPEVLAAVGRRTGLLVGLARRPLGPDALRVAAALDTTLGPEGGTAGCVVADPHPEAALARLLAQVAAAPRAALVLAALLRQTELLPVTEALAAEASAYSALLAGPEHQAWLAARGPGRPAEGGDERVRLTRDGDRLDLRLVRVARRNAFDALMRQALVDALDVALADPRLTVRLSGDGPVFSAGGDLDEFGTAADPATAWVVRVGQSPGHRLALLGERASADVHGPCAGAGVELPAFAARLTADPATTFRLPELAMGLLPGAGGTVSLVRRVGRWRVAWLALSGEVVGAGTALDWGLVDALRA